MTIDSWQNFRLKAAAGPRQRIVLADGEDPRVLEAAYQAKIEGIAEPIVIGSREKIDHFHSPQKGVEIEQVNPKHLDPKDVRFFLDAFCALPKNKLISREEALSRIVDPLVLGCLMVRMGKANGFIGGATRTTADTLRAAFSIIGLANRLTTLFGFFLIEPKGPTSDALILLADCAVTPDPSAKHLAHVAVAAADALQFFTTQTPRVAFLSFSTAGSATHEQVEKVRQALALAREKSPDLMMEGEWQADAALDKFSAEIKGVGSSPMAGKANILIVPDLNTGNIAYKLVQRLGGCRAVGPVLWGLAKPANDLSRGCSVDDVLDMMALTSLQAAHLPFSTD